MAEIDIFASSTDNFNIITLDHMKMNIAFDETPVRMSVSSYRHRGHFVLLMGHPPYIVIRLSRHSSFYGTGRIVMATSGVWPYGRYVVRPYGRHVVWPWNIGTLRHWNPESKRRDIGTSGHWNPRYKCAQGGERAPTREPAKGTDPRNGFYLFRYPLGSHRRVSPLRVSQPSRSWRLRRPG